MKNFTKLWAIMLLITTAGCFAGEGIAESDFDIMLKPDDFADLKDQKQEELKIQEEKLRNSKPIDVKREEQKPLEVTSKGGFFDTISNWSNKRTLSKIFTKNANNNATDENIFSNENNKTMWKSLSTEDQEDLINEWSKTRNKKVNQDIDKDKKIYKDTFDAYASHGKKETLAKIDHAKKEIKKNETELEKIKEKLSKTTSKTTERLLNTEIDSLNKLNRIHLVNIENYQKLIEEEEKNRAQAHEKNQDTIKEKHDDKIKNFINSIYGLDDSKVEVSTAKDSKVNSEVVPADQKEAKNDLIPEDSNNDLKESIVEENPEQIDARNTLRNEYTQLTLKSQTEELNLPELEKLTKFAKELFGEDSIAYKVWEKLRNQKMKLLHEELLSARLGKSPTDQSSIITKENSEGSISSDNETSTENSDFKPENDDVTDYFKNKVENWSFENMAEELRENKKLTDKEKKYTDKQKEYIESQLNPKIEEIKTKIRHLLTSNNYSEAEYEKLEQEQDKLKY